MYKTSEAAAFLGIKPSTVQQYCRNHNLGIKEGKTWYLSEEDIQKIRVIKNKRWNLSNGWISVEDDLPEGNALALNNKMGSYGYGEYLIGYIQNCVEYYRCENEHEILNNVTHWMPLPAPPPID